MFGCVVARNSSELFREDGFAGSLLTLDSSRSKWEEGQSETDAADQEI